MNNTTILRTSAVLFAEDSKGINPIVIKRKMIESIFIEVGNRRLTIVEIVDYFKKLLDLDFTDEEVFGIIQNTDEGYFDLIPHKEASKTKVELTPDRFKKLEAKVESLSFDDIVDLFGNDIYEGSINTKEIKDILHRYVYYLINTNHNTLTKILSGTHNEGDISLCDSEFELKERDLINQFINWENTAKNKSLFVLISYSIEYCLVVNNADSESFIEALKNKTFYLDNNILYRALGINGAVRQNRITAFLDKCIENGQTFIISKHTFKEFNDTIKHHIKHLSNFPAAKISPQVFERFNIDGDVAKFYYTWKTGRSADGPDLFKLHIDGLLRNFMNKYEITKENKLPFDITTPEHKEKINNLASEIENVKQNGQFDSHETDAENIVLIDFLRDGENASLSETKIYLVSTDQRLRNWDYQKSEYQPIVLLPSHWMSLLLRYVSRTDSDYNAFTSFLKLKNGNSTLKVDYLQQILTGISNITQDFENQTLIVDSMMEQKFDKILEGLPDDKQIEEIEHFAEKELDLHFKRQKEKSELEKKEITSVYQERIEEIEQEKDLKVKKARIDAELKGLKELEREKTKRLEEKKSDKSSSFTRKYKLDLKAEKRANLIKAGYIVFLILYVIALIFLINKFEFVAKYWGFLGLIYALINYLYMFKSGKTYNPVSYFKNLDENQRIDFYSEYDFNLEIYISLDKEVKDIEAELEEIKRTITMHHKTFGE